MKITTKIIDFIIAIPFVIIIGIIAIPFIIIFLFAISIMTLKDKMKLKRLIKINNESIYFLYSEYNNYNFLNYFQEHYPNIICVKVNYPYEKNLLIRHLIKDCVNKCYPRLVMINDKVLIQKEHYGSFKKLYKRDKNINAFFDLIEKSIINLKKNKAG